MAGDLMGTGCIPNAHGSSPPGTGPCERCGRPRCNGTSTANNPGERCRRNPIPGGTVCKQNHGGAAPQVQAAAAERLQEQGARDLLAKQLVWNPDAEPVLDSAAALRKLMGQLQHTVEVLGRRLSKDTCEHCGRGPEPLDGATGRAWQFAAREFRSGLADMERHGLAAQFVEVEAGKVRLMATGVGRMFDALELTAEQRELGTRVLMETLRAEQDLGTGPEVVTGQVTG